MANETVIRHFQIKKKHVQINESPLFVIIIITIIIYLFIYLKFNISLPTL